MATKASPIAEAIKTQVAAASKPGSPDVGTEGAEPKIDYVCGLRRVGPSKYVVVSGLVRDGVPDLRVEAISQSLDHAAEELRSEFQRLVEFIP